MENSKRKIIDSKIGNIMGKDSVDRISLVGTYENEDTLYVTDLELILNNEKKGQTIRIKIPYEGYYLKLFLGDFNGDEKSEIMVRGGFGGSGGFQIAAIFNYENNTLKEIFNQEIFSKNFNFESKYLNSYVVYIESINTNEEFYLDISRKEKIYLNIVYDSNGKVKKGNEPTVSNITGAYPINSIYSDTYSLLLQQRIIGVSNADTLGVMETYVSLIDNRIDVSYVGLLTLGKKKEALNRRVIDNEILSELPNSASLISLDKFGGRNNVIEKDLDGDGAKEVLVAYELEGMPNLCIFKEINEKLKLIDTFKGDGTDIENLMIIPIKSHINIIIGWKIEEKANKLDILRFKNGRIHREFKNKVSMYGKIEIEDLNNDGNKEIMLWIHDTREAYMVKTYNLEGNVLKLTEKYDSIYFKKVEEYYENLLNKHKDSTTYLYYLALAHEKVREYEGALKAIEKALLIENPYPSVRELNRVKKRILSIKENK